VSAERKPTPHDARAKILEPRRLALVYSSVGKASNDTNSIVLAIRRGERLERERVIRWLVALENDDSYEWGPPIALANAIYLGAHDREGT
jgi:hypothetical protein